MQLAKVHLASGHQLEFAENGAIQGEPILFVHGWPDSWFTFSRVLPLLPPTIRSLAPTLRGFGGSDRPACCYGISDFAQDAVDFLDALSLERVTVVGHSLGSFVARRMAIACPERIVRVVLIGTGISPVCSVLLDAKEVVAELEDPIPLEFVREFQAGTAVVPLPQEFFEGIVAESQKAPARVWRDALDGLLSYDDEAQLPQISVPTLILWGDKDAVFDSSEEQDRLSRIIPSASLKVYRETGHCLNWERPDEVAADLANFVLGA